MIRLTRFVEMQVECVCRVEMACSQVYVCVYVYMYVCKLVHLSGGLDAGGSETIIGKVNKGWSKLD